jgi:hypothetical protein
LRTGRSSGQEGQAGEERSAIRFDAGQPRVRPKQEARRDTKQGNQLDWVVASYNWTCNIVPIRKEAKLQSDREAKERLYRISNELGWGGKQYGAKYQVCIHKCTHV